MDADTKLMVTWRVGRRDAPTAREFMEDLEGRLANRVQLTTDGHAVYLEAVESAFGAAVDYAMLVKIYGGSNQVHDAATRYSPPVVVVPRRSLSGATPTPTSSRPPTLSGRI